MQVELRTYLEDCSTYIFLRFPTFKLYRCCVLEHSIGYQIIYSSMRSEYVINEQNLYLFLGAKLYHGYKPIKLQTRRQVYNMLKQMSQPGFVSLRKNCDHLEKDYFVRITLPEEKRNEVVESFVQNVVHNNIRRPWDTSIEQFRELLILNDILI